MKGSMALALPYQLFEGRLGFPGLNPGHKPQVDQELKSLVQYLKSLKKKNELIQKINVDALEFDIGQGLLFNSNIPQGFGMGSSGALTAAVVEAYAMVDIKEYDLDYLRSLLALVESYYHGASSGFDPLVSLLGKPVLKREGEYITDINIPHYEEGHGALFLINTGRARRTEPLVNLFLEKCKDESFEKLCRKDLREITNHCIDIFLEARASELYENFSKLSAFQLKHFAPMIPKLYMDLWTQGLESSDYALKLCGAGGGGFLIGMARNFSKARELLANQEIRPLFNF